ncbi:MAG: hypothetical protein NT134_00270 [Chloroflexi bacterium]|nr:hypothetical protein [Chloroflexota bacterium]
MGSNPTPSANLPVFYKPRQRADRPFRQGKDGHAASFESVYFSVSYPLRRVQADHYRLLRILSDIDHRPHQLHIAAVKDGGDDYGIDALVIQHRFEHLSAGFEVVRCPANVNRIRHRV